jgi:hypothetical protein
MVDDEIILLRLEELAERLGILGRDENINIDDVSSSGGLCLLEGKYIMISIPRPLCRKRFRWQERHYTSSIRMTFMLKRL